MEKFQKLVLNIFYTFAIIFSGALILKVLLTTLIK